MKQLLPLGRQASTFRKLSLGLFQDGDVRVGILPEGKEILIGSPRFGCIALQGVSTAHLEMRQCADRVIHNDAATVEDFLKLDDSLRALTSN